MGQPSSEGYIRGIRDYGRTKQRRVTAGINAAFQRQKPVLYTLGD